jgi:Domain of unknown function (DUF4279)
LLVDAALPPSSPLPSILPRDLDEASMSETDDRKFFRTLRGFLSGEEPDEPTYFAYSATLRIFGEIPDLDEITGQLGVAPTSQHRRGERRVPQAMPYSHDMWSYEAPVAESEPLHAHIDALWNTFRARTSYLLQLKQSLTVDVFLGYRSNCDHAGVEVPPDSLEMFVQLEIPFGLSIILT